MNLIRASTGDTRCKDSALYASKIFNFYRCAAASCVNTTADRPVDFYIDGTTSTSFDRTYDDPTNACNTVAAKRVNVFAFNGASPFHSLTTAIASPDGWVDLSSNASADAVLTMILGQQAACTDLTPLADSLCAVAPLLGPSIAPAKKLKFLTDGGENVSVGLR